MTTDVPYVILVVCDSNFKHTCVDPDDYVNRLKTKLAERVGSRLVIKTIDSKYGFKQVDPTMQSFETEDKNKTSFVQTVENVAANIDELLVVSIVENDPYLEGLKDSLSRTKTVTRYRYLRKE